MRVLLFLVPLLAVGCAPPLAAWEEDAGVRRDDVSQRPRAPARDVRREPDGGAPTPPAPTDDLDAGPEGAALATPAPLEVTFLGVGGFLLRYGDDAILTAPLFSNPSMTSVVVGEVASDPEEVARFLPDEALVDVRAILVGHGHYDHLMDVPSVWTRTPAATIYGNVSTRRMLAAYAPDQPDRCDESLPADAPLIPRDAVVALNDPTHDVVDYRGCPAQDTCFAARGPAPGDWVYVPGSHVRLRALCNTHPAQFGPVHFGRGCVDEDACAPPARAIDWREGETLAYLIDFLDDDNNPVHRVYYQDAPAEVPVGAPAPELLVDKRVDAALLCVGTYDQVEGHPTATVQALDPRFAIGGHWEDFFRAHDAPLHGIPFLDIDPFRTALGEALPPDEDGTPRAFVPDPGAVFAFAAE